MKLIIGLGVALLATAASMARQFPERPAVTEPQARGWAVEAAKHADGDPDVFNREFVKLVKAFSSDYEPEAITIHDEQLRIAGTEPTPHVLVILLVGPTLTFQRAVAEQVRKMLPIATVTWDNRVRIIVLPQQIDSPDVERVVVKRGSTIVEPIMNLLLPSDMQTALGVTRSVHKGTVLFPIEAFAPGMDQVTVTAIPRVGDNIVRSLANGERLQIM